MAFNGSLDDVWQEYPATAEEALAPRSLDKRLPYEWLKRCYVAAQPIIAPGSPAINGLKVYFPPQKGRQYIIGADPAAGNPTSDDSAVEVMDKETGEEVATLAGKFEPATFGAHIDAVGKWYNNAAVMLEVNNHGHAVMLWLKANSSLPIMEGPSASTKPGSPGQPGWTTTNKSKAILYATAGEAFRDGDVMLHDFAVLTQLASIEGSTLKAPEGQFDDRAIACCLCIAGVVKCRGQVWIFGGSNPKEADFLRIPGGDPTMARLESGWSGSEFGGGE